MADARRSPGPGGFLPQESIPSPAPSNASSRSAVLLPHPRKRALLSGSNKEDLVRRYVEEQMAIVSRRYVKKYSEPTPGDDIVGYESMSEVCKDIHKIIDVLWLSGTPSLQIPFLLNIASDLTKYVVSFPPAPRATFSVLRKLDHCFASLLDGEDVETRETLPGFENGLRAGMTTTDMVRCRSSVEQTRVLMVEVLSSAEDAEDESYEPQTETDTDAPNDAAVWTEDDSRLYMDVARVYEKTLVQLGERLGDVFGATPAQTTQTAPA
ncbi:hypothetical protein ACRALDRAFT_1075899 [Sodiomyces alcalophilus JCM 7366]|uniref:uncharacterized protein n=1 Tax=Sodiomyces alcalophilus JCM 7366 TaxID=591952 RepID=UPI0039B4411B